MHILLLEDNYSLNKAMKEILELHGHDVTAVTDGMAAKEQINKDIDLYLLDITVPHINGVELLDFILTTYPKAKAILISADIVLDTIYQTYAQSSVDSIKKPFMLPELLNKISNLCNT